MYHPEGPTFLELMRQALASTEEGYDLLAPKFDRTPFRTPDAILEGMMRAVGAEAAAPRIETALDVCCGTGAALAYLRSLASGRVVGLDFSAGMLAEARRRLDAVDASDRVDLVRGDAFAMPFDAEFDLATCFGALGHVVPEDEDRFVGGIARALKPGGRFVFATGEMPSPASASWWMSRGFNAVMRARNALLKPPFIMYYLTFLWPDVRPLLERHGFDVVVHRGLCARPFERALLVVATRTQGGAVT